MGQNILVDMYKDANRKLSPEEIESVNKRFLLIGYLSTIQQNIATEIEGILNKNGVYRMQIKHNHKKIVDLIKSNTNDDFYATLNDKQIEDLVEDYDALEKIVFDWAGIKQ